MPSFMPASLSPNSGSRLWAGIDAAPSCLPACIDFTQLRLTPAFGAMQRFPDE
jgi:hypothetical protein